MVIESFLHIKFGMDKFTSLLLLLISFQFPISGQSHSKSKTIDARELEAFLDPIFSEQMKAMHIPAAVFVFVKDGQIFFEKGYGLADIDAKKPVVPNKTLFQIGSITKLFTATAVMQLVEQNKLDVQADVNQYLTKFQIKDRFAAPVTLHHLLTHTGGFDERFIGTMSKNPMAQKTIGDYLAERMPPRVMPSGEAVNYSNHGMTLAGHLVEQASGLSYEQYVTENILQPLEMHHTKVSLNSPNKSPAQDLAVAYDYRHENFYPIPASYYGHIAPAGSIIATSTDMAHFMIAHLQRGRFGDKSILSERTIDEMHRQQFTHHPKFSGWTYGFPEESRNGRRLLTHGGGARGYVALLVLLPEENAGFFIACNTANSGLQDVVFDKLIERYYPNENPSLTIPPGVSVEEGNPEHLSKLTGSYRYVRYSRRSLEKILAVMQQVEVTLQENGKLSLDGFGSAPILLTMIEPFLFRRDDGKGLISFRQDEQGRITHLFLAETFADAYEKLDWYESAQTQTIFAASFALTFLSAVTVWLATIMLKRFRLKELRRTDRKKARILASLTSLLNLIFLVGFPITFLSNQSGGIPEFFFGLSQSTYALLCLPIVTTVLTCLAFYFVLNAWRKRQFTNQGIIYYAVVVLVNLAFIPYLLYWNLLGFW